MRRAPARTLAALVLALTAGLVACGEDDAAPRPAVSDTEHSAADVEFASDMIQHHAQALSMVDLTMGRPLDPEVERLVEDIRAAQGPEIETMADWLTGWGEPVPETMRDHVNSGHGDGDVGDAMEGMDHDMPGMMSAEEMTALQDAPDAEFQDLWLTMMIEHHEGAIDMARTHLDRGTYRPSVELAETIAESQADEIDTMKDMVNR